MRKSEALGEVHSAFDATTTADLTPQSMDKALWLLTHVRPNTKVADLRCKNWHDLYHKLKKACSRVEREMSEVKHKNMLQELEPLSRESIDTVAEQLGFEDFPSILFTPHCR